MDPIIKWHSEETSNVMNSIFEHFANIPKLRKVSHIHLNLVRTSYFLKWAFLSTRHHCFIACQRPKICGNPLTLLLKDTELLVLWSTCVTYCRNWAQTLAVISNEVNVLVNWFDSWQEVLPVFPLHLFDPFLKQPLERVASQEGVQHFESRGRRSVSKDLRLCGTLWLNIKIIVNYYLRAFVTGYISGFK